MRMRAAMFGIVAIAVVVVAWAASGTGQRQDEQVLASRTHLSEAASPAHVSQVGLLKVEGMFCAGCAVAVQMAAKKVAGVDEVKVSTGDGTAEVTYDPAKTSPEAIASVITENTGFKTEAVENRRKL